MSYKKLEIWQLANELVIKVHKMTMEELPGFELYEEGSQIRRSSKSSKSQIVEGYGRRRYKMDFLRFLTYSIASNDETIDHLENLFNTGSLKNEETYNQLKDLANLFGRKLNNFISSVEKHHNTLAEPTDNYYRTIENKAASIPDQESSI